jgi:hypothetical protein
MQQLRVDTASLQAIGTRWGASAGELNQTPPPAGPSWSSQPSAAAVDATYVDVGAFTAELARRVDIRARHVANANCRYIADDAHWGDELAAMADSATVV